MLDYFSDFLSIYGDKNMFLFITIYIRNDINALPSHTLPLKSGINPTPLDLDVLFLNVIFNSDP